MSISRMRRRVDTYVSAAIMKSHVLDLVYGGLKKGMRALLSPH